MGSIVELISGSTRMAVVSVSRGNAVCVWGEGKRIHRDTFPVAILRQSDTGPLANAKLGPGLTIVMQKASRKSREFAGKKPVPHVPHPTKRRLLRQT